MDRPRSIREEFHHLDFGDSRLNDRFVTIMERMEKSPGKSIASAFSEKKDVKAAYRFFENSSVTSKEVYRSHEKELISKIDVLGCKRVIISNDTTSLAFAHHPHKKGMGYTYRDISGFFFHCALTMTEQGIPLGIFSPTTWSRGQLEPGDELWDSESVRWTKIISEVRRLQSNLSNVSFVVVGDRESDIKDCFNEALRGEGVDCVARSKARTSACLDPREKNQKTVKITDLLLLEDPLGQIEIDVLDRQRNSHGGGGRRLKHPPGVVRKVQLDVYAKEVQIKGLSRPIYAVLAKEAFPSPSEKGGICWLLKTTLEVKDISQGQDVIEIYKKRWPIETYFKVLKSGCKIEDCRLDKYEEVEKFLAIQSMVALRLLQLTYWERESPDTSCSIILSDIQWKTLWHTFNPKKIPPKNAPSIQQCTRWIAQLGGHHDNRKSRPPGVLTMWRGWQKLVDLSEGFELALKMLCVDMGSR